jgi:SAM-dependent methyltransferase
MAGWDSHIPDTMRPQRVVGLGLNRNELAQNEVLDEFVLHDLNKDPSLPFPDSTFDVVLNTVSVDYLTRPFEVFREVGRILKPGGLFLVIFSNRMFEQKATKIWRQSGEEERVLLVADFFHQAGGLFTEPEFFLSKGKPRPENDKYAHTGIPSDPIYAAYAERTGGSGRRRPAPARAGAYDAPASRRELRERMAAVARTLRCPHCDERLRKWAVPASPFDQWGADFMYICFNDQCPYLVRGWEVMHRQGNTGASYRFMYDPQKGRCLAISVPTLGVLKDGIVD